MQAAHFADISELAPPMRFVMGFMPGFLSEPNSGFLYFPSRGSGKTVIFPTFSFCICSPTDYFPNGSEMKTSNSPF